ncbi:alpha/beta fold hydrolase [Radiobacillus deserti]|uniref:alpha/beta fold hydrolase n=1 Tax=Radiobacillus deserti TaxID=2594883 RepID=UPI001E47BE9F|nr:alpha/beta hydrolase [Radiobacillus deserti]
MIKTDRFYVETVGTGTPLLFLPAAGFSGKEGLNIAEHLKDKFETHLIDLPGLGRSKRMDGKVTSISMANWAKDYLDQQGIAKALLIGHSLGGAIWLALAVHYPERVKKLILLDQGHKPYPRVPKAEFGIYSFAFPFLNSCVYLFGERFLNKLTKLFTQEEKERRDINKEVMEFCNQTNIQTNRYVKIAIEDAPDFSSDALPLLLGYYNLHLPNLLKQVRVETCLFYGTFEQI